MEAQRSVVYVSVIPSFGFWSPLLRDHLFGFVHLAHLALQNVDKDYATFSYFCNFVTKSDQKPKTKNGMNKYLRQKYQNHWSPFFFHNILSIAGVIMEVRTGRSKSTHMFTRSIVEVFTTQNCGIIIHLYNLVINMGPF